MTVRADSVGRGSIWRPCTEWAGWAGWAGWAYKVPCTACRKIPCPSAAARGLWGRSQTEIPENAHDAGVHVLLYSLSFKMLRFSRRPILGGLGLLPG